MTDSLVQPLRSNKLRLSARAHHYLQGLIEDGTFHPGEQLPSQNELALQLGISRATLREALLDLEREGFVVRRQGVGTFVAPEFENRLESGVERLESILETAARQGMELELDDLRIEEVPADRRLSGILQVEPGTVLTSVRRVLTADGTPVAYMHDLVPSAILAPSDIDETFGGSVLDLLREKSEIQIDQVSANLAAVNADKSLSSRLRVNARHALLLMEETLFDAQGKVVEFSLNYFVPDFFKFHVVRR
jgi:GntR family transcriptional regulator